MLLGRIRCIAFLANRVDRCRVKRRAIGIVDIDNHIIRAAVRRGWRAGPGQPPTIRYIEIAGFLVPVRLEGLDGCPL